MNHRTEAFSHGSRWIVNPALLGARRQQQAGPRHVPKAWGDILKQWMAKNAGTAPSVASPALIRLPAVAPPPIGLAPRAPANARHRVRMLLLSGIVAIVGVYALLQWASMGGGPIAFGAYEGY